jgi:hypothetical protein
VRFAQWNLRDIGNGGTIAMLPPYGAGFVLDFTDSAGLLVSVPVCIVGIFLWGCLFCCSIKERGREKECNYIYVDNGCRS